VISDSLDPGDVVGIMALGFVLIVLIFAWFNRPRS